MEQVGREDKGMVGNAGDTLGVPLDNPEIISMIWVIGVRITRGTRIICVVRIWVGRWTIIASM